MGRNLLVQEPCSLSQKGSSAVAHLQHTATHEGENIISQINLDMSRLYLKYGRYWRVCGQCLSNAYV